MTAAGPLVDLSAAAAAAVEEHRAAPAAVVAAAVRRDGAFVYGVGAAGSLWPSGPPAAVDTLFDLASVTKPLTALALARLERAGLLRRDERLADVLPSLAAKRSAGVTLDLLAAHRAGLDAHRSLYAPLLAGQTLDPAEALVVAADARREGCEGDPPADGFPPVYSDLGYLLLGAAIAARGGADLDLVVEREVVAPLGLRIGSARRMRARDVSFDARVAPTEVVEWRGGAVRGAVHDENAWAFAGDASAGHAGLFGDADPSSRSASPCSTRSRVASPPFSGPATSHPSYASARAAHCSRASTGAAALRPCPVRASGPGRSATSASPARASGSTPTPSSSGCS